MGSSPARSAASTLAATSASVSPNPARRSECPTITSDAPASLSISAETDPVQAPDASAWQSCPPTATTPPFKPWAALAIRVAGRHSPTRVDSGSAISASLTASASASDAASPFIFQLPTIIFTDCFMRPV